MNSFQLYRRFIKPLLDRAIALLALVSCAPIMAAIAVAVYLDLGRPILFVQLRPGKNGRLFRICKFRTMTGACNADSELLPDGVRLTKFGKWLRSTSLDELPELWNVLRGEMSLVGPRPLLPEYLPLYSPHQERRHEVKPGLTGLAQVRGRNGLEWLQRLELDVWYVDHLSFLMDARIVAATLVCVLSRRGITAPSHATMHPFTGQPSAAESPEAA